MPIDGKRKIQLEITSDSTQCVDGCGVRCPWLRPEAGTAYYCHIFCKETESGWEGLPRDEHGIILRHHECMEQEI